MATTKIWKVEKRLDHVMNYTTNEEKTKNKFKVLGKVIRVENSSAFK